MRHVSAVTLLALCAVAACSDRPAPTEPTLIPTFDVTAAASGASIVRGESGFQVIIYDAERQLLAFHNFRNAFPVCGQPVTQINLAEFLEVHSATDATLVNKLLQSSEAFIWVWHSGDGNFLSVRCTAPIAQGVGRFMYTDNDVNTLLGDRARANTWGFKAEGNLTGSDGTAYHYSGLSRFVLQADGVGGSFKETVAVNLGPAGQ